MQLHLRPRKTDPVPEVPELGSNSIHLPGEFLQLQVLQLERMLCIRYWLQLCPFNWFLSQLLKYLYSQVWVGMHPRRCYRGYCLGFVIFSHTSHFCVRLKDGVARIILLYAFLPNSYAAAPRIEPTSLESSKVAPLPTELPCRDIVSFLRHN